MSPGGCSENSLRQNRSQRLDFSGGTLVILGLLGVSEGIRRRIKPKYMRRRAQSHKSYLQAHYNGQACTMTCKRTARRDIIHVLQHYYSTNVYRSLLNSVQPDADPKPTCSVVCILL